MRPIPDSTKFGIVHGVFAGMHGTIPGKAECRAGHCMSPDPLRVVMPEKAET